MYAFVCVYLCTTKISRSPSSWVWGYPILAELEYLFGFGINVCACCAVGVSRRAYMCLWGGCMYIKKLPRDPNLPDVVAAAATVSTKYNLHFAVKKTQLTHNMRILHTPQTEIRNAHIQNVCTCRRSSGVGVSLLCENLALLKNPSYKRAHT